jgi:hypothetical protein
MKDVYEVLQQKEAAVANVRHEVQSLNFVSSLLSDELALKDAGELLRQKEADVARVRHEIESLKIVAPLLSEELASDELSKMGAGSAAQERRESGDRSQATGTDGGFSLVTANPRRTFWKLLKRKT